MRVALVCPYAWDRFGGVQSHVRSLAAALRTRGHDVLVLAPHSAPDAPPPPGVAYVGKAVPVPANGSVAALAFGPSVAAGARRVLVSFEPDVLHLHEPLIPSLSFLALRASDVPAVGTFHAAAEWSFGYGVARGALAPMMRRLAVRTVVSDSARALVARYFPGDYVLTPNGIDTGAFEDADPRSYAPGDTVVFFSRLERRKGLEVLVRALAALRDDDLTLVIAGAGPEERRVKALAARLGVEAVWLGRIPEEDVAPLYRGAGVYCAPGLGGESFGIVLVEAMAAGTPVVCSDLPGFRAVASDAAALVPPGDPQALADALVAVLEDEPRRRSLGAGARRLALERYSWDDIGRRLVEIYEDVAS